MADHPADITVVPCKWILKSERNAESKSVKYQGRLVICGHLDNADLGCTSPPKVDFTLIQLMLAIAPKINGRFIKWNTAGHSFKDHVRKRLFVGIKTSWRT